MIRRVHTYEKGEAAFLRETGMSADRGIAQYRAITGGTSHVELVDGFERFWKFDPAAAGHVRESRCSTCREELSVGDLTLAGSDVPREGALLFAEHRHVCRIAPAHAADQAMFPMTVSAWLADETAKEKNHV